MAHDPDEDNLGRMCDMKLRMRGGYWQVDFLGPGGRRQRVSTKLKDKVEAEARAAEIIRAAHREPPKVALPLIPEGGEKMTLSELVRYCERVVWRGQRSERERSFQLAKIKASIGEWKLSEITYPKLVNYCEELRVDGLQPATINRYMSSLSRAMKEAERMGWLVRAPRVPRFKEPPIRERYLSPAEEERLLAAIGRRCSEDRPEWVYLRALVPVLLDTGMRLGEALGLRPEDLTEEGLTLRYGETKSNRGRHVPMTPRAQAGVILMLGSGVHGRIRGDGVFQRFKLACKDAGITGVSLHTLRHTCASRLVQSGVSLYVVKEWLGHSTISVTERYAHLSGDALADAARTLAVTLGQLPAQETRHDGTEN